jgi:hypothetical protein
MLASSVYRRNGRHIGFATSLAELDTAEETGKTGSEAQYKSLGQSSRSLVSAGQYATCATLILIGCDR